jgi:hypothetical protein
MNLRLTLLIGLAIRLALLPFIAHPLDMYAWYDGSQRILGNPFHWYSIAMMWWYTLIPIAFVYRFLASIIGVSPTPMNSMPPELDLTLHGWDYVPLVTDPLFNALVKIPTLLSDAIMALLLFKFVGRDGDVNRAERAALLWFLNPYLIWISAGWGQFDSLPTLFTFVAYLLALKSRVKLSAVALSISVGYKLYPTLLFLPILVYLWKTNRSIMTLLRYLLLAVAVTLLLFVPILEVVPGFTRQTFLGAGTGPFGFGLTYWSIALIFSIPSELVIGVSLFVLALGLGLVYRRTLSLSFLRPEEQLASSMLCPILVFFIAYRIVPEQFIVWILPFMIVLVLENKIRGIYFSAVWSLAFLHSITQLSLPFFMLPTEPWLSPFLVSIVKFVKPFRIGKIAPEEPFTPAISVGSLFLASVGIVFSLTLLGVLASALWRRDTRNSHSL